MTITRNRGLKYSDYIVETVNYYFSDENSIHASIETFYNCREQGYVLEVHSSEDYSKSLCIWICAQRNSDDPMIVWEETVIPQEHANMFTEESYYNRCKCFDNVSQASMEVVELIKRYFNI